MARARQVSSDSVSDSLPLKPKVFMILLALADGPAHGYEVKKRAEGHGGGGVRPDPGSMYRTLAHLLDRSLIRETRDPPDPEDDDARRRYYELTDEGRAVLAAEAARLAGMVDLARAYDLIPSTGGSR